MEKDQLLWMTTSAVVALFICAIGRAIHRLYLGPLAKFPGPKLAALTRSYEIYFDGVQKGKFIFEIERMHQQYGML